jgi:DNA invertase Pin-like site-specific DNA recombinase
LLEALLVRGAAAVGISGIENAPELNIADGRPELAAVIEHLRPGGTLAVWRLDRLGRSFPHLLETVANLESIGVGFASLTERRPGIFTMFGALSEFERNLLRKRTFAGMEAAK